MRLGRVKGPSNRLVVVEDGRARDVGAVFPSLDTVEEVIRRGPACWNELNARVQDLPRIEGDEFTAPIATPSKVICVGLNYVDHALEQGVDHPPAPLIFAKFPSAIVGPGDPITWPAGLTQQVDYEAELAVIIGAQMRSVDEATAVAGIFGYTVANDVSARDLQFADGQFTPRGKSLRLFLPLGPVVVTADEFGDASGHRITARVNGETLQDSNTFRADLQRSRDPELSLSICNALSMRHCADGHAWGRRSIPRPPKVPGTWRLCRDRNRRPRDAAQSRHGRVEL